MLVGRAPELDRLDRLLEAAAGGLSAALVIRGEPGIGKSALIDYAGRRAEGMQVLRTRGMEETAHIPFAQLGDLLRPLFGLLGALPGASGAALAGALGQGPPVAGDRFAVSAATLGLLAAGAEQAPLVVLVDDLHWLDTASAECLLFVARRLEAEGIVALFAARTGEPAVFSHAELPELRLGGLDEPSSRALLAQHIRDQTAPDVVEALLSGAGGNPLALRELPGLLSPAQRAGREPLEEPLRVGRGLQAAFARRIARLPQPTRLALLLAAAADPDEITAVAAAARQTGIDAEAFEPAEAAGLVRLGRGRVEFDHPLVRGAVYYGAPARDRRAAHRALAEHSGADPERRAWHLAAAALVPDEGVAVLLDQAGELARARSGYSAAAQAYERAADLTPQRQDALPRLVRAAEVAQLAGLPARALALLDRALEQVPDANWRATVQHLRGQVLMWAGPVPAACEVLVAEAERIAPVDRAKAALMLADASVPYVMAGDVTAAVAAARRASVLAEGVGGHIELIARMVLDDARVISGEISDPTPFVTRIASVMSGESALPEEHVGARVVSAAYGLIWLDQYEPARQIIEAVIRTGRTLAAPGMLPYALGIRSDLDFRTGHWPAALAGAAEALRLAEETDQGNVASYCLWCLARIEAAQGRSESCRHHAERALRLVPVYGATSIRLNVEATLGFLELGMGRAESALEHLEVADHAFERAGVMEPNINQWEPDFVEACMRAGRPAAAERAVARFAARAMSTRRPWSLAALARCRGLLAEDNGFEQQFHKALAWHDRLPTPFERARTELCYGERLRRVRRRGEAQRHLRTALAAFEDLGAAGWAPRARAELEASGDRAAPRAGAPVAELTVQELQVALAVAEGATNRQVAATLFLSPKTVEYHLGHVFQKLNVRSRAQLGRVLAATGPSGRAEGHQPVR